MMTSTYQSLPLFLTNGNNASGARDTRAGTDRHMDLNYDLFVDLTPEFNQPPQRKDRTGLLGNNMKMTPNNLKHGGIIMPETQFFMRLI